MSLTRKAQEYKQEINSLASGLPVKLISIPEFKDKSYEPESIRQKRTYYMDEDLTQPIKRFLIERGVVEILPQEKMLLLFKEIHWCVAEVWALTRKRTTLEDKLHEMLIKARKLVSRIESAEEELFIANRRLVVSCAKTYFWMGGVWLTDLLQEGSKALSNATRKYDYTRGIPFYAYSQKAIQNRLRNYFRDHVRSGNISIRPTEDLITLSDVIDKWKSEHNDAEPDNATLATITGLSESRIKTIRRYLGYWRDAPGSPLSLDSFVGDSDMQLHQLIEDPFSNQALQQTQHSEIWDAVDRLPDRSRRIMRLRFLEGRTLEETGHILKLTRARIKQIEDTSLRKLRQMLRRGVKDPNM